jgi:ethanolamine permease
MRGSGRRTMSVFGALLMYIMAMLSLFRLRRTEPALDRPFRAPVYPFFPALALAISAVSLVTVAWLNPLVFALFAGAIITGFGYFLATRAGRESAPIDELLEAPPRAN